MPSICGSVPVSGFAESDSTCVRGHAQMRRRAFWRGYSVAVPCCREHRQPLQLQSRHLQAVTKAPLACNFRDRPEGRLLTKALRSPARSQRRRPEPQPGQSQGRMRPACQRSHPCPQHDPPTAIMWAGLTYGPVQSFPFDPWARPCCAAGRSMWPRPSRPRHPPVRPHP